MTTAEDVIRSAASVSRDVAEGRLDPAALDAAVAAECRQLFSVVVGRDDPLWALHVDVARQVLGLGGLSADELTEWLAVARRRLATASASSNYAGLAPADPTAGGEPGG